jgi:hypothetical protein
MEEEREILNSVRAQLSKQREIDTQLQDLRSTLSVGKGHLADNVRTPMGGVHES